MRLLAAFLLALSFAAPVLAQGFSHPEVDGDAKRFETYIAKEWDGGAGSPKDFRRKADGALRLNDPRAATGFLASLVKAAPADAQAWLDLSRAYLAIPIAANNYAEQQNFPRHAASSALIAARNAKTAALRATALSALGDALTRRSMWRPAIAATKASLAAADNEGVRASLDKLLAEHGFRMMDYTVDSELPEPRLCVQFSEGLGVGDFASFVTVSGAPAASLKTEDSQLCVEGLMHGQSYDVKIRAGLPSAVQGEETAKPIDLTIYVRDRKPAVRFTGRAYVLPRSGQQGIPVVSVNTPAVKATLLRVNDRRLAPEVLDGQFGQQLEGYKANEIAEKTGEKVWEGAMPVASELNREVTTAFPVDAIAPGLKPGLYALVAQAEGSTQEDYEARATQWFVVSDIGLAAVSAADGVHVFARALGTAQPMAGVPLRLVARNNEVLGEATTDAAGRARFDAGLAKGAGGLAPALVVAEMAGDYGFLDLTAAAFDLADRGVGGRLAPASLDAFLSTERGVYRPGETVHLTALLRDADARAVPGVPLTLRVLRPDGVEHARIVSVDGGAGGRAETLALPEDAATGTWRIAALVDPAGAEVGETKFLVEDYQAERLELTLTAEPGAALTTARPLTINAEGRWLYGAPAAGLALEGELIITADRAERAGFAGFRFGLDDETFTPKREPLAALPALDSAGRARLGIALPELPETSLPLKAEAVIRLREPSGRALARTIAVPMAATRPALALKPAFDGGVSPEGRPAMFEVALISPGGERIPLSGVRFAVSRIDTRFQWYAKDGNWSYDPVTTTEKVSEGVLNAGAEGGRIEAPAGYGRYRVEVSAPGASAASLGWSGGWAVAESADTPDTMDVSLDRPAYAAGDTVNVALKGRMAGEATVLVLSDRVLAAQTLTLSAEGGRASFTYGADWGPGAYVVALLHRPMDVAAKRMPGRAIGVAWLPYDLAPRRLDVALGAAAKARPGQRLAVPVKVAGLTAGQRARVVVTAVDAGILSLTAYRPPNPLDMLAQRRLGAELRDIYGRLIDGMQATRGALRTGGDGVPGGMSLTGLPASTVPVAFSSGLVETDAEGNAEIGFDVGEFDGTLRLMAVAWSEDRLGAATADTTVRDVLVITAAAPRFLTLGDTAEMSVTLAAPDGAPGEVALSVSVDAADAAVAVAAAPIAPATPKPGESITRRVALAAASLGRARLAITATLPDGTAVTRHIAVPVLPAAPRIARRTVEPLAAGATLRLSPALAEGLIPGTAKITVAAGRQAGLDVPGLLLGLDRYPYGCAEQTVSRALPLLYLNQVAEAAGLAGEAGAKTRITAAIARLAGLQDSGGAFGLWRAGADDLWLTAYVTDFLVRAQAQGHAVSPLVLGPALDRLKNLASNTADFESGGEALAYALYVLSAAGRPVVGDLRYYADVKLEAFATPLARAQLGAALAMRGDGPRAARVFASALAQAAPVASAEANPDTARLDYGTAARDRAGLLALVAESRTVDAPPALIAAVAGARRTAAVPTTQEAAWTLLAARALAEDAADTALEIGGQRQPGPAARVIVPAELVAGAALRNLSEREVTAAVTVEGASATPEPAAAAGFIITREVFTPAGAAASLAAARQNDRFVIVLKVTEDAAMLGHIMLEDRLPAGFEIENPKLVKGADLAAFGWLDGSVAPAMTAFRDDRFNAAFSFVDVERDTAATMTVAYVMRAVTPGEYLHPGASVEDMYRPGRMARTEPARLRITPAQ